MGMGIKMEHGKGIRRGMFLCGVSMRSGKLRQKRYSDTDQKMYPEIQCAYPEIDSVHIHKYTSLQISATAPINIFNFQY